MDLIQDYAHQLYTFYQTASPYLQPITSTLTRLQSQIYPLVLPLFDRFLVFTQDSPAIVTIGALLVLLVIAFQILSLARRVMMFWMKIVMRLMFWGAVGVFISVVAQRGVGRTVEDLVAWGGELSKVWWREYRRWDKVRAGGAGSGGAGSGYAGSGSGPGADYGRNARAGWR